MPAVAGRNPNVMGVQSAGKTARESFRPDVEGFRRVAILPVVAYHVGIPGCSGGFIGVDTFFALSGYLITGLLLHYGDPLGFISRMSSKVGPARLP